MISDLSQQTFLSQTVDNGRICRLGLVGAGIAQSKSPALHEAEAKAQGIHCRYELIDLDQLGIGVNHLSDLLNEVESLGFSGLNITVPCKQAVIPLLHELSPEAQAIGAVNTVRFHAGRRIGYNTDAKGFGESFRRGLQGVPLDRVLQYGAGGAGAATAFTLLELGVRHLTITDIIHERAQFLADSLALRFTHRDIRASETPEAAIITSNGVVNASPTGTSKYPGSAMPLSQLRPDMWIAEVVYAPLETELLRSARAMGCRTLDGASMLVFQAARAFELFTGHTADIERMLRHFSRLSVN
ncbi:shikimate dehydrogenase [Janthinobacterium lividum]|uniref:shikimate dehydrogenase n=1 Tax=Janthinobacterium lividum TaxID=29581 RepID=UPI000892B78E|nr:shikimate dehydrogenase [Janthinobacterium lividum]MCC7716681.1 shikimate dehydrogenase [Janthinobacterium lividum]OEZ51808.1 quinate/shikimate dehydrogenase [Janthinobacterium lividum]WQE31751.1 shikimate dehydrogenase [Janthinobacterium lividum]STS86022.1 Quinate/shikimate dehydrogenase [Janthinobacterium lividum]